MLKQVDIKLQGTAVELSIFNLNHITFAINIITIEIDKCITHETDRIKNAMPR
jgi:hypothetical protein